MLAVHMGRLGVPDLMTCFTPLRLLHLTLVVSEPILRHTISCLVNFIFVFWVGTLLFDLINIVKVFAGRQIDHSLRLSFVRIKVCHPCGYNAAFSRWSIHWGLRAWIRCHGSSQNLIMLIYRLHAHQAGFLFRLDWLDRFKPHWYVIFIDLNRSLGEDVPQPTIEVDPLNKLFLRALQGCHPIWDAHVVICAAVRP